VVIDDEVTLPIRNPRHRSAVLDAWFLGLMADMRASGLEFDPDGQSRDRSWSPPKPVRSSEESQRRIEAAKAKRSRKAAKLAKNNARDNE